MSGKGNSSNAAAGAGLGFGAALAIVMSWTANKAIVLAIFHGLLGWIYVIYYIMFKVGWSWL
jgi:hypothetical protein